MLRETEINTAVCMRKQTHRTTPTANVPHHIRVFMSSPKPKQVLGSEKNGKEFSQNVKKTPSQTFLPLFPTPQANDVKKTLAPAQEYSRPTQRYQRCCDEAAAVPGRTLSRRSRANAAPQEVDLDETVGEKHLRDVTYTRGPRPSARRSSGCATILRGRTHPRARADMEGHPKISTTFVQLLCL